MTFANAVNDYLNNKQVRTANGMRALETSASACVDFFNVVGASRGVDLSKSFIKALNEHEEIAVRTLLWARDVRGGAGERQQFRNLLQVLEKHRPEVAERIMPLIPVLGRWDDLFSYRSSSLKLMALALYSDALYRRDALAAKWAPREKGTKRAQAKELMVFMGLSPRNYRKLLANATQVVETAMCAKNWESINFEHVPSLASARYQAAFNRNCGPAYEQYKRNLKEGKETINAGAIFPHDVVKSLYRGDAQVTNAQWNALPNYIGDSSIFTIVDTSGSMGSLYYGSSKTVQPIEVAVALGLYCSEKNKGALKNLLMVFNTRPELVQVRGSLSERVAQLPSRVSGSTNLHAAFDMLLGVAVRGRVHPEDMPKTLLILSDMQFNCCHAYDDRAIEMIRRKYASNGYTAPRVVFWNLSPYGNDNTPVRFDENGTALISGFSPAVLKSVLSSNLEQFTPVNVMLETVMNERYAY